MQGEQIRGRIRPGSGSVSVAMLSRAPQKENRIELLRPSPHLRKNTSYSFRSATHATQDIVRPDDGGLVLARRRERLCRGADASPGIPGRRDWRLPGGAGDDGPGVARSSEQRQGAFRRGRAAGEARSSRGSSRRARNGAAACTRTAFREAGSGTGTACTPVLAAGLGTERRTQSPRVRGFVVAVGNVAAHRRAGRVVRLRGPRDAAAGGRAGAGRHGSELWRGR